MRKCLTLLLLLCLLCPAALAESQQPYDTFLGYYQADVDFINDNTGRRLLPLVLTTEGVEGNYRLYRLYGDVLSATVRTQGSGKNIVMCQIVLAAPEGMQYGDAAYNDFVISGYHSYALLMAMSPAQTAQERYDLVQMVNNGMKQGDSYQRQVGAYKLTSVRDGSTVTITLMTPAYEEETATPTPVPSETPMPVEEDGQTPAPDTDDFDSGEEGDFIG